MTKTPLEIISDTLIDLTNAQVFAALIIVTTEARKRFEVVDHQRRKAVDDASRLRYPDNTGQ